MRTVLLSTVAAAALTFAGTASAQNLPNQTNPPPERAPAAQQHAPAEKVAPPMNAGEHKAPGNAQLNKGRHETTGAEPLSDQNKSEMKGNTKTDVAPGKTDEKADANVENKNNTANETNKSSSEVHGKSETTAQGSIASGAKLSSEQRGRITTIFHHHRVAPAHLNVSVRVGVRVPASVHFYPVPAEVIEIYPEWRGYDYILVGDQILIVDPQTHEIVAVLEA